MLYNYVVTAQKPTSVTMSLTCNFTAPNETNLIMCKNTRVEIHTLTPEGLQPVLDVCIYGRIASVEKFRPSEQETDWLFLSTEKCDFCVLSFDRNTGEIVTQANGTAQDRIGRPAEHAQMGIIDPKGRIIGMHLYTGLFKIVGVNAKTGELSEAFNVRLEELHVIDIQFLHDTDAPTLALLYQDNREGRHVKTYEVNMEAQELTVGPVSKANVDSATMLVPVPAPSGGVLIVGELGITYMPLVGEEVSVVVKPTLFASCGFVDPDGSRLLLGDVKGGFHVLLMEKEDGIVTGMKLQLLGATSVASSISYLDSGVVFVGSSYGDSQLVKLMTEPDEDGSYLQLLDTFTNLGPIVDFRVVDLERQGQGQIVTCSGAYDDGTIRVVRSGIGINEQASVEMPGVKGIWSLSDASSSYDHFLVVSFVGQTRFLAITDEEIEETSIAGFDTTSQTLLCQKCSSFLIQVTQNEVRVVNGSSLELVSTWRPDDGASINVVDCNSAGQLVLSAGNDNVVLYLETDLELGTVSKKGSATTEHEVACLSLDTFAIAPGNKSSYCALGLWTDISARILSVPAMEEVTSTVLGGEFLPRSVALTSYEGSDYLLVGLGDGHLFTFSVAEGMTLGDKRKLSLGTQPITMRTFSSNGNRNLFAVSDRPTVIYSNNKKLLFSNVNLPDVEYVSPFNTEAFPDSLAIYSGGCLTIGTIDDIQKLHIRTVRLGEMPRRIAHHESSNSFAVLTVKSQTSANGLEEETSALRLLDNVSFERLDSFELRRMELACSVEAIHFEGDTTEYIVAGTALARQGDSEPKTGRLLVFRVEERKLVLVTELDIPGAAFCLTTIAGGRLLAGVNSVLRVYAWKNDSDSPSLEEEARSAGNVVVLRASARGTLCIAGDLMRSISLFNYNPAEKTLVEIARDYNPNWVSDVTMLDDDTFLNAENSFNLYTVTKNVDAMSDEERGRLETCGEFHLGEAVNRFREGSLVMRPSDTPGAAPLTTIFATVAGAIGVVASLSKQEYDFFRSVEQSINNVISGVGGLDHKKWRSFSSERKHTPAHGFIDGDLVESFLDLNRGKMEEVAKPLGITVENLRKRIEDLAQSIH